MIKPKRTFQKSLQGGDGSKDVELGQVFGTVSDGYDPFDRFECPECGKSYAASRLKRNLVKEHGWTWCDNENVQKPLESNNSSHHKSTSGRSIAPELSKSGAVGSKEAAVTPNNRVSQSETPEKAADTGSAAAADELRETILQYITGLEDAEVIADDVMRVINRLYVPRQKVVEAIGKNKDSNIVSNWCTARNQLRAEILERLGS